jgi:hypothetical protein
MMKRLTGVCLGLALLASCASTKVVERWADPDFDAKLKNIMVLSLNQSEKSRRLFEDGFLHALAQRKIQSSASYDLLPSNEDQDKEKVKAAISGSDIDGVLVLRAVKITKEERYVPAQTTGTRYNSFYAYVGEYRPTYSAYTTDDTLVHLETNLYAVDGAKLIWTGKTETFNPSDVNAYLVDLTKTVLDEIDKTGFIQ